MRTPLTALAVVLVLAVGGPALASDAAQRAKPKPDLKITQVEVTGTTSLSVSVQLKNAGTRKAGSSTVALTVSRDATASSDDAVVGTVKAPKVKPRKKAELTATVQVPAPTVGTYYLIACADSTDKLKERKEGNNCRASAALTVSTVTVTGAATAGGSVTAATSAGVCSGATCTVPSGAATVTLTPVAAAGNSFAGWSGASCPGTTDTQKRRVITNPTATVACTATFAPSRAVTYNTGGAPASAVAATTTAGSCAVNGANTGGCTVPSGAATVTLTASSTSGGLAFNGWSGDAACTTTNATVTITNPTADLTCTAAYLPI
ncbi:hypothetical protein G5V58_08680 [Nocardioides anomalus]|uniref:CARDB domain-containing protein n=1 Tax=Nocardioides anomalus TaxID=2712223 RepID=A0A6G6WCL2_9ACTN|nr:CARDB domain-containing protein [Nocardioides anomalus]QIG42835.1 hypothetical protein G5V58_08680 [Nocardioides anomalus]